MGKIITTLAATSVLLFSSAAFAQPVIVIDHDAAISSTTAFQAAEQTIKTTYAAAISSLQTKQQQYGTELQTEKAALEAAGKQPAANKTVLEAKVRAFQEKAATYQRELEGMALPIKRTQAYVIAQIDQRYPAALKAVMNKHQSLIVVQQNATVAYQPSADATADMVAQLNTDVPSVSTTPPADWQGQALPPIESAAGAATPSSGR
jgi:Skp family chaperone for outer membrane proteins